MSECIHTRHKSPSITSLHGALFAAVVNGVILRQLYDDVSSTYTYLVACPETRQAVLIDPVLEQVRRQPGIPVACRLCQRTPRAVVFRVVNSSSWPGLSRPRFGFGDCSHHDAVHFSADCQGQPVADC